MSCVLVKYGGAAIDDPADRTRLMRDLARLHDAGSRVIVVHGGGPQMTAVARSLGIQPTFVGGRRVTDAAMLEVVQMVLAGRINTDLMASALGAGLPAIAMCAASGRFVTAVKRPPRKVPGADHAVDFGFVADVAKVDPKPITTLWDAGFVPVLSSLVADADGQLLNLNADTLVRSIAGSLPLSDVVYVADVRGVFADIDDPSSHIASIHESDIPGLIDSGSVRGGMIAKLDEIGQLVRANKLSAWIVGRDTDQPVSSALHGEPAQRTRIHAD